MGKGHRGLGEKHHAKARDQQIEAFRIERVDGRIGQHEIERQILVRQILVRQVLVRQVLARELPRQRQHRRGDVDAEHMA